MADLFNIERGAKIPSTGDNTLIFVFLGLAGAALVVLAVLIILRNKRKRNEEDIEGSFAADIKDDSYSIKEDK